VLKISLFGLELWEKSIWCDRTSAIVTPCFAAHSK